MPRGQEKAKSKHHADPFTYKTGAKPLDGYTIKRGIGHGGFGEVYYATSEAGKEVALKLIRRSLDVELRGIKHCLNLKHQNLLDIYDIRQDEHGDHWVVMEFVSNECLDLIIDQHPKGLPAAEALRWFHGIAAGVAYLHNHGIVHRDLKPGNVFSEDGRIAIGDYGLSKFISCSRRSGHTESIGTIHYMAPEVANGRYGKEIDIYALGVILYELLTGHVPFEGESVGEVLMKHLTALPDVSMLAEPYRTVVLKALEKDPDKRYSSVEAMVAQLPQIKGDSIMPVVTAEVVGESASSRKNGKRPREFHPANLRSKKRFRDHEAVPVARIKTPREISLELVTSMLIVLPVVGIMAVIMSIFTQLSFKECNFVQCAWVVLVSIVGAWAILIAAKSWESLYSHGFPQRFLTLAVGLLIGLFAMAIAEVYQLKLPYAINLPPELTLYRAGPDTNATGIPWHIWLAAFATVFFIVSWTRQATLHRRKRLSFSTLLKVGVFCAVAAWAWGFPQPWLIMVGVTISTAIQVAAPWERKRKRYI
ncbi:MAG: serine/threonine-protein kinase [Planctomycetia bacterium]|jgi:serine/threonine protein kinase